MQFPEEFVARMQQMLGEEYEDFIKSYDRPAAQALRINTGKISVEAFLKMNTFLLRPVPWVNEGFYYEKESRPGKHPYHEAGLYYIQEPSAMAVGALAAPCPGERVLDLCAAPGGKTTHLAAAMKGKGVLVANEPHPARAKILAQNVERMGIPNAVVTNEYPQTLADRFPGWFDRIVVDAPCSGEGMFLKEEQALIHWSPDNVKLCADRQDEILEAAAKMLRPGGTLIYSTCTFAPEEDEGSMDRFMKAHPDFHIKRVEAYEGFAPGHPEWAGADPQVKDTFRLWPHKLEGEGHYVAVLQRDGDEDIDLEERESRMSTVSAKSRGSASERKSRRKGGSLLSRDWEIKSAFENFAYDNLNIIPGDIFPYAEMVLFGDNMYLLPCHMNLSGLKVLRAGLHLGTYLKNRFEPSHALALVLRAENSKRCYDLKSMSEAESYLKGQTITCDGENGWTLVLVDGYSLGWGKVSGGVLKNHYPRGLRWV